MSTTKIEDKRVFAYIIATVDRQYGRTGCVPWVEDGKVFFGPCKKKMRPEVRKGDYILGISGSSAPKPRKILLWMEVAEKPLKFSEAWERGNSDPTFRRLRGSAIHVRPLKNGWGLPSPACYEHIPGAPHELEWKNDVRGCRDAFLVGGPGSWVAESDGPDVTLELVDALRFGINWKGRATIENPLTENARGKHVLLTGTIAQKVISWMPMRRTIRTKNPASSCQRKCSCE